MHGAAGMGGRARRGSGWGRVPDEMFPTSPGGFATTKELKEDAVEKTTRDVLLAGILSTG